MIPQQHFEGDWKFVNLYGLLLGLVVGHSIILFNTLFTGKPIQLPEAELVLWVSLWTLYAFANAIAISTSLSSLSKWVYRRPILAFYVVTIIALLIGFFLGITTASFFFPWMLLFIYKSLLLIVLLASAFVCVGIQLFESQIARNQQLSILQEVEVLKLHGLTKQAKLRAIQTKINPHLLYNALNSIAVLIQLDGAKAEDMTKRLAQFYSYVENEDQWITIQEELLIAKNYLEIEHVRFGDLFHYEFTCDADLLTVLIPRFLLQPLLENAVKHGLATAKEPFISICVNIRRLKEKIQIVVYDNGGRFPKTIKPGYGLKSVYTRLKLHYGSNYMIKLENDPQKYISMLFPISANTN